jgi:2-(1,2-epoxy-1,2-dihydrophenyl)acetyl-CoA isomerase
MTYKCLLYDEQDGIVTLTLNRPERLNALGDTLRDDLHHAIIRASADAAVRVIILTGAGRGFCSGGDVKAMHEAKESMRGRPLVDRVAPGRDQTLLAMRNAPQPLIAAINGPAAGAGMNLALACDMRIASTTARFGETFVKRGLHVDWGGTYFFAPDCWYGKSLRTDFYG